MQRKMTGKVLAELGIISNEQLAAALDEQRDSGDKLDRILVRRGIITDDQLLEILEFTLEIPRVSINRMDIDPETLKLLPAAMMNKYRILPLSVNQGRMTLIMADPLDFQAIDDARIVTGLDIVPVMATEKEVESAIQRYTALQIDSKMEKLLDELGQYNYGATGEVESAGMELADDAPVIRMVNSLLRQAVRGGASDIHIEPLEHDVRVRFRIDGDLWEVVTLPKKSFPATVSRIKIMADLDISEKRIPQDGRTRLIIDGREIDFRISSLPSIHGEKIVLRVLDRANAIMSMAELGFSSANEQRIESLIRRPHGMVIVTGPSGSGKSTALYSVLNELNNSDRNIVTLEDPVEYSLPGITQVQINPKAGLTFPAGLRSILRQDPDIIMVGEMRDGETAELGVRAALTGHLFFSTLHTNSAAGTIARMVNMGIENYLLSSSLAGVVSQRLIRRLCKNCRRPYKLDEETAVQLKMPEYAGQQFFAPVGCNLCRRSGYSGRMALHEVLAVGPEMRKAINNKIQSEDQLEEIAVGEGMVTIIKDGIYKACAGMSSLQEVMKGVLLGA